MSENLTEKLKKVKLVITDVDGVLTDGSFYIGDNIEMKRFNSSDGLGFVLLRLLDIPVAVISGRYSKATIARTRALQIPDDMVFQDTYIKTDPYVKLKERFKLKDEEIAYMGDDYIDMPLLKMCGVAFAPANAITEIKDMCHYVSDARGGSGAFREMIDLILRGQNRMEEALEKLHGLY